MTVFLLIRHAENEYVKTGRLAGWLPDIFLNAYGKTQAEALAKRLANLPLTAIYSSPLERTVETADMISALYDGLSVRTLEDIGEVHYGDWQGEKLDDLRKLDLWKTVQHYPSRMKFPGGEAMRDAQARAVNAIEQLRLAHTDEKDIVVIVSHSDIIKMIVSHYLGQHLDVFQRINISTASISTLILKDDHPVLQQINDTSHNPPRPKDDGKEQNSHEKNKG